MSVEDAIGEILPCCGSRAWARGLAGLRPVMLEELLLQRSDRIWWSLAEPDWDEAFRSHPRIGEKTAAGETTPQAVHWSAKEQSKAADLYSVKELMAEGQRAYEAKFGRIFIVCATGKSASEMLAMLDARMENDPVAELRVAAEQQRQITQLRLRKWMRGER
jgi:2-oxo-4-hydroxy-4-carboxy-5-ureidoimidazoline decarboxylase